MQNAIFSIFYVIFRFRKRKEREESDLVKLPPFCFHLAFLENCRHKKQKESIKYLKNFCSITFFVVLTNSVSVHFQIWCSHSSYSTARYEFCESVDWSAYAYPNQATFFFIMGFTKFYLFVESNDHFLICEL